MILSFGATSGEAAISVQQGCNHFSRIWDSGSFHLPASALASVRTLDIDSAGKTLRLVSALGIQFW